MPESALLQLVPPFVAADMPARIALTATVRAELADHLRTLLTTSVRLADLLDLSLPAALVSDALEHL